MRATLAAALETLERECITQVGDWRVEPPHVVFDREKAAAILEPFITAEIAERNAAEESAHKPTAEEPKLCPHGVAGGKGCAECMGTRPDR